MLEPIIEQLLVSGGGQSINDGGPLMHLLLLFVVGLLLVNLLRI